MATVIYALMTLTQKKESVEFMNAIAEDVKWLGYSCHEVNYASDYFEQLYNFGVQLIQKGSAYVDSLSAEELDNSEAH